MGQKQREEPDQDHDQLGARKVAQIRVRRLRKRKGDQKDEPDDRDREKDAHPEKLRGGKRFGELFRLKTLRGGRLFALFFRFFLSHNVLL